MSDVFAITHIGMSVGQERLLTLSTNAAHATQPGYKRQVAAQASGFAAQFDKVESSSTVAASAGMRHGVDIRAGALMTTARPLDLAVEGAGSFFALADSANLYLTRAGSFHVDAEGYLVGERDLRVQGTNGDLRVGAGDISVRSNGEIVRGEEVLAVLQLFKPAAGSTIGPSSGALLEVTGTAAPVQDSSSRVRSGVLEASNAGGPQDMLALMTLTRQFESLVKVTQGYDEVLGRAIQKLGEI
jgi:flagellar basal body rod protein FlgG